MAYNNVAFTIAANILSGSLDPGTSLFAGLKVNDTYSLPNFRAVPLVFGTGAGKINLFCVDSGTLVATTKLLDLTALPDRWGANKNFARGKALLVLNFATTDGFNLLVGGAATNPWSAPFNGVGTSKLVVPPGFTDPNNSGLTYPGMLMLSGGNTTSLAVSGTSKILQIDSGANTVPYAVLLAGCDA